MPDQKITQLTALAAVSPDDLLVVVDAPATTPATRKITASDLGVAYPPQIACGRLTLQSGVAVPTADITAAVALYFTPYLGNRIALYDSANSRWKVYVFTERSISLAGKTTNTNHDVFLYDNAGVLTLELVAWSNSGAGTSTRATALALQDGVLVKSSDSGKRYLGTIRIAATGQCEDSATKRFVWNLYNQSWSELAKTVAGTHTYETATYRAWNNDATVRVEVVCGQTSEIEITLESTQKVAGVASVAQNLTNAANFLSTIANENTGYIRASISKHGLIAAGYHFFQAVESGGTGGILAIATIGGGLLG